MRHLALLSAVVAAALLGSQTSQAAHLDNPNQLVDAGFENPLTFDGPPFIGIWEGFNSGAGTFGDSTTNMPRTGAASLELVIDNTADAFAGAFQDVAIPASVIGQTAYFSGWHKLVGDAGGSEYRIEWRDASGAEFFRDQVTVSPGSTYEEFIISAPVPAGAETARIVYAAQSFGGALNQTIFVDDVNFNVVGLPEPTTALLVLLGLAPMVHRRR